MESQKPELEQQDDLEVTRMSSHHGEPSSDYVVPSLHNKVCWDLGHSSHADCKLQFNSEEESSSSKATSPASNDKEDVHKDLALKNVRHFILDEYDKMLEPDEMKIGVAEILEMTPHDKQVMMFSATLSTEIRPVCKPFMRDPKEVYFDDKLTLHDLTLHYIKLSEKNCKLNDHLDALDLNQVVIIVKSVSRAAELNKLLVDRNFPPSMGYVGIQCSGFEDFHLKPGLLQAIVDSTFEYPSEVQQQCIPRAILGGDVLCQAKAGTGKSAVFVLSTLQQIEPVAGQVAALVLCHTRELSYEIYCEFKTFSTHLPDIKVAVFNGDVEIDIHKDTLKNNCPHILVGTLGTIRALARDKDLALKNVRHFILDECDKMLEPDAMKTGVVEILEMTPRDKQVMMFSATLSTEIRSVCTNFMRDPVQIYLDDEAQLSLHCLMQHYIKLSELEKNRKLNDLLDALGLLDPLDFNQVVIFVESMSRAAEVNKLLVDLKFPSICIYSGMSQEERLLYKGFREGHHRILVTTDLFGCRIYIEHVNIVINYDMPDSANTYLHRVSRAGRFGTMGLAVTFVSPASDPDVLNQVQERFEVGIKELPKPS